MKNHSLRLLTILNVFGLILMLTLNFLAVSLPLNNKTTGELSDNFPNYFVPAGFTFSIWGLIYLCLIAFVIYQLKNYSSSDAQKSNFILKIDYWFLVSCIANASWIIAWHYQEVFWSLTIMLVLLYSLMKIYIRIREGENMSEFEKYFVSLPFSIYLGWISVAAIANFTTYFIDIGWDGWGIAGHWWAVIMICVAVLLAITMVFREKDRIFIGVIVWAIYGIYAKQNNLDDPGSQIVAITALCVMMILIVALLYFIFSRKSKIS